MKTVRIVDDDLYYETIDDQFEYENLTFALTIGRERLTDTDENLIYAQSKSFRVLDDNYLTIFSPFYMRPNSFISEVLNSFIIKCHEHGLMQHIELNIFNKTSIDHAEQPPQVLDMHKLSAGFIIWLGSVMIACIVFFCEIIFKRFSFISKDDDDDGDDDDDRVLINILKNASTK